MGLPTVEEVQRLALPSEARLAGGAGGLHHLVQWAHRMSVYPPAFANLEEAEFALLTIEDLTLLDERLTLGRVVETLAELRATGLAVIGNVPDEAVAVADQLNLPLFRLPSASDLRDIERDIIRLIVEREAQLDRRGRQIYRQLAQLAIENRGLSAIATELLHITKKPIIIQDEHLTVQASAWPETLAVESPTMVALADDTELRAWLRGRQLNGETPLYTETPITPVGWTRGVATIIIEGRLAGYLSTLSPEGGMDDLDRLAVERGALVCAVEMAKQRAVEAARDRLHSELLDLILTASGDDERIVARRAAEMHYDLGGMHVVCVFDAGEERASVLVNLASEFRATLLETGIRAFLSTYEGQLVALCTAEDPAVLRQIEALAEAARVQFMRFAPDVHISAGIGRPGQELTGLRRSFVQAGEALTLARTLFGEDRVLAFSDLGMYRLLCRLQDCEELNEFFAQTLAPLVKYDSSHHTELVPTLEAYFAHQGNVSQTAESLFLHRNSLLYRLERINQITGLDLANADDRFSLELALRIRPFVSE
ncbi:MAG: hypothetical protein GX620_14200 [Chloroflexi bacterium]|nr:hypothetical protein [Chloroflexota bacterium]